VKPYSIIPSLDSPPQTSISSSVDNNKNRLFGALALVLLFFAYDSYVLQPYFAERDHKAAAAKEGEPLDAVGNIAKVVSPPGTAKASIDLTVPVSQKSLPSDEIVRKSTSVHLENEYISLDFSTLGARITSLKLKKYKHHQDSEMGTLELIDHVDGMPYPGGMSLGEVSDIETVYEVKSDELSNGKVTFAGTLSSGQKVLKTFALTDKPYFIDFTVTNEAGTTLSDAKNALTFEWSKSVKKDSPSFSDPYSTSGFIWFDGKKISHLRFEKMGHGITPVGPVAWSAFSDKYFSVAILPVTPAEVSTGRNGEESFELAVRVPEVNTVGVAPISIFAGPKDYHLLNILGSNLEKLIDFGMLGFLSAPLLALLHFFYQILGNYGVAIVALTLFIKTLLLRLNKTAFRQMKGMQDLQPEVQKIRKDTTDAREQQQKLMELYKKRGVNPMGGCFPMLVQLPIFLGLYNALLVAIELRHAPFALWIQDLSDKESLDIFGIGVPVMVVLFVASMILQQWITPTTVDPAQKKAMLVVPLIFGFMFVNFPAGLTLYWLTNNLISITQAQAFRANTKLPPIVITLIASAIILGIAIGLSKI
jgi:YidC/Oxa1 family membrane protein insertase